MHFVGSVRYGSANQANSAFHPFGVGKCITGHGNHKTADQGCVWLFSCR